jgi:histidine triad (HIT) family protein
MDPKDCIFCKIAEGTIPSTKLYEDDMIMAFEDINPVAPVHFLVIPKKHIATLDDIQEEHASVLGKMSFIATKLAREKGLGQDGYRQVINCRESAGQVVFHLHLHIIGGRQLGIMG